MIDDVYGDGGATGASGNGRSGRPSLQDNTPLPWRVKIIYGIGEIGIWCTAVIQGFFLTSFLLDTAGISAGYVRIVLFTIIIIIIVAVIMVHRPIAHTCANKIPASNHTHIHIQAGTILLIGQLFDSITNPIIGVVSDSCRTRIGRRRPWLLASAIPFGASFFGIFLTWSDGTQFTKFCYYLVLLVLFSTVGNMLATPYAALTSDLATTYDQSTELTQIRMLANIISGVIVSFTHSFVQLFNHLPLMLITGEAYPNPSTLF
jgi:Na+/melibiose symporter-like transporter